jgi:hypothetical protein
MRRTILPLLLPVVALVIWSLLFTKGILDYLPSDMVGDDISYYVYSIISATKTVDNSYPKNYYNNTDVPSLLRSSRDLYVPLPTRNNDQKSIHSGYRIRRTPPKRSDVGVAIERKRLSFLPILARPVVVKSGPVLPLRPWIIIERVGETRQKASITIPSTITIKANFAAIYSTTTAFDGSSSTNSYTKDHHAPSNATTPIGMAVACPQYYRSSGTGLCLGCHNLTSDKCHTVYVGHIKLGAELHWSPPKYLQRWWNKSRWSTTSRRKAIAHRDNKRWNLCDKNQGRPVGRHGKWERGCVASRNG